MNQNGEIEDRKVELGMETASDAEVTAGLNAGEEIVVSDRSGLKAGEKVHPHEVSVMEYHGEAPK